MLCSLVDMYRCFEGNCCLQLQDRDNGPHWTNKHRNSSLFLQSALWNTVSIRCTVQKYLACIHDVYFSISIILLPDSCDYCKFVLYYYSKTSDGCEGVWQTILKPQKEVPWIDCPSHYPELFYFPFQCTSLYSPTVIYPFCSHKRWYCWPQIPT
jgi:hypothetical protein